MQYFLTNYSIQKQKRVHALKDGTPYLRKPLLFDFVYKENLSKDIETENALEERNSKELSRLI